MGERVGGSECHHVPAAVCPRLAQFLIWYFPLLPPLLLRLLPWPTALPLAVALELGWGSHPPSAGSSAVVCGVHAVLMGAMVRAAIVEGRR